MSLDKEIAPNNVTEKVVPAHMCVGCGVCAGVCPVQALKMNMHYGKYTPSLIDSCLSNCRMCLDSCPFYDHDEDQDDIARTIFKKECGQLHHTTLGYYLACYIGYSRKHDHRAKGASGGMTTWLIETLLEMGDIDGVVTVRRNTTNHCKLFEMAILTNTEEVRNAASSYYYPVELAEPLHAISTDKRDMRYAVVGVPCFLYGVRLAMEQNHQLNHRISFLFGLACGLYPSAHYTEVLSRWVGVFPSKVRTVGYRFKEKTSTSIDFHFRAQHLNGRWSKPIGALETFRYLWSRYYFAHNACLYCDDVFAETADAVFMDAWLPCELMTCPIEQVLASQESSIYQKREAVRKRIKVSSELGLWLPRMQIQPNDHVTKDEHKDILRMIRTVQASQNVWPYLRWLPTPTLALFFWIVDTYAGGWRYATSITLTLISRYLPKRLLSLLTWLKKR